MDLIGSYGRGREHFPLDRIEHFRDYALLWTWNPQSARVHWVNWFRLTTWALDGAVVFAKRGTHEDQTTEPRDALAEAGGFVKFDGCSQWRADVHFDSRAAREEFYRSVTRAHDVAAEIMGDTWDGEEMRPPADAAERDDLSEGVDAGRRAALACQTVTADLVKVGELCEMQDDEYPLRAVQRVLQERDAALARIAALEAERNDLRDDGLRAWKRSNDEALACGVAAGTVARSWAAPQHRVAGQGAARRADNGAVKRWRNR